MRHWRRFIGLFLIGGSALVQAASVTIAVTTTVFAVPCTSEQRTRMRACVTPEQQLSTASRRASRSVETRALQGNETASRQDTLVDPAGQIMVRTLLY